MNEHESYVSPETAKMLKKTGFHWEINSRWIQRWIDAPTDADYVLQTNLPFYEDINEDDYEDYLSAPTLEVAQRWLRENHNMHIMVDCIGSKNWLPTIQYMKMTKDIIVQDNAKPKMCSNYDGYDSYEEALEAGIHKCLTLLLEEKK